MPKAKAKAIKVGIIGVSKIGTPESIQEKISYISDAKIIGMLIRKENSETSLLEPLQKRPAIIVAPLREMPGKIAILCASPIKKEDFLFSGLKVFVPEISTIKRKVAVNIKQMGR